MAPQPPLILDHITVVARTLADGAAHIKRCLGIDMPPGGAHPKMGTHNQLMSLGRNSFLELIAIDPDATPPEHPRWFKLDSFDAAPRLATWVVSGGTLDTALKSAHPDSGRATEITRGDLKWLISIPKDGTMPMAGAFPTLIEWPDGESPANQMVDLGCRLKSLTIQHPNAPGIAHLIGQRIDTRLISITAAPKVKLTALIQTPSGERVLS